VQQAEKIAPFYGLFVWVSRRHNAHLAFALIINFFLSRELPPSPVSQRIRPSRPRPFYLFFCGARLLSIPLPPFVLVLVLIRARSDRIAAFAFFSFPGLEVPVPFFHEMMSLTPAPFFLVTALLTRPLLQSLAYCSAFFPLFSLFPFFDLFAARYRAPLFLFSPFSVRCSVPSAVSLFVSVLFDLVTDVVFFYFLFLVE